MLKNPMTYSKLGPKNVSVGLSAAVCEGTEEYARVIFINFNYTFPILESKSYTEFDSTLFY